MNDLYLRPYSAGEILQETLRLYERDWPVYLAVVATVQVPLGLIAAMAVLNSGFQIPSIADASLMNRSIEGLVLLFPTIVLNVLFTISAVYGAVAKAVHERCSGRSPTFGSAMSFGWTKLLALLCASLLIGLALTGLSLLALTCIGSLVALPAILYFTTKWLFFAQAIVLDDFGARASLRRSSQLVTGRFWRTLGISLLLTTVSVGLVSVPTNILGLFFFLPGLPVTLLSLVFIATNVLLTIVATPIQMIGLTLAYYDAKAR